MRELTYEKWIGRERRIRKKILQSSPVILNDKAFRTCDECEKICLCHEDVCPNCNSSNIVKSTLDWDVNSRYVEDRIRCQYRFMHVMKIEV